MRVPRVRAKALGVIAIKAQPLLWPPQQAEARRQRLAGQRRDGCKSYCADTAGCIGLTDILISRPRQEKEIIGQLDLILQIEAGGVLRSS